MVIEFKPYVGPRPFEREDKGFFFGREREARELLSLTKAHRAVLLYAQSGAGKTSLLNAKLIPNLEEEGFEVLPLSRVRGVIPEDVKADEIANIYVFNTLMSWSKGEINPRRLLQMSFVDFLKEREHLIDEMEQPLFRFIIFDQFEELLSFYPERWKDREGFFEQVVDALEEDPLLRVVFAMREDCIAQIDPYSFMFPEKLRSRFHLKRLRKRGALSAITEPLRNTRFSFEDGVPEKLVEELLRTCVDTVTGKTTLITGEFIESVQLQVVCQSLWNGLPHDVTVITMDHLKAFGDVNQALSGFYERAIKEALQQANVNEGDLREWFERSIITPAGTRGTVYRGEKETAGIPNEVVNVLDTLHIISGEWRAGARWYEITHDRFVEPIQKSNRKWFTDHWEEEQARRWLETKTVEWVSQGEKKGDLLDEIELIKAERWLYILNSLNITYSEDVLALVDTSRRAIDEFNKEKEASRRHELLQAQALANAEAARAEEAKRSAKWARQFSVVMGVLLLIAIVAVIFAFKQNRVAKQQARISHARELVREAITNLEIDPELSVLLALNAVSVTHSVDKTVTPYAEDALHRVLQDFRIQLNLSEHTDKVTGVAFSPDGTRLATASLDGTAIVWDSGSGQKLVTLTDSPVIRGWPGIEIEQITVDLAKRFGFEEGIGVLVTKMNEDDPNDKAGIKPNDIIVKVNGREVNFSTFFNIIAEFSPGDKAEIELIRDGKPLSVSTVLEEKQVKPVFNSITFNPDGSLLATGNHDKTIVWNINSGKKLLTLSGHTDWVKDVAFSHDGTRLATASDDGTVKVWDVVSGKEPLTLSGHTEGVLGIAFSPNGKRLASASRDKTAKVWNVDSGKELATFSRHKNTVIGVAFSPDGTQLATAGRDMMARIWNAKGKELHKFSGHTNTVIVLLLARMEPAWLLLVLIKKQKCGTSIPRRNCLRSPAIKIRL